MSQNNKEAIRELSAAVTKAKADYDYALSASYANENVDKIGGFELLVKTSENAWLDAKVAFGEVFPKVAFTVFVTGSGGNELAAKIKEQTDAVAFDMEALLTDIMAPIQTQARASQHFGVYEFNVLQGQIRNWADSFRLNMPMMSLDTPIYVADEAGNVDPLKVRNAAYYFLAQLPAEFFRRLVQDRVVREAADMAIDSSVVPVIITNTNEQMIEKLSGLLFEGRNIVVEASTSPTAEEAVAVLKQIKNIVSPTAAKPKNNKTKEANNE